MTVDAGVGSQSERLLANRSRLGGCAPLPHRSHRVVDARPNWARSKIPLDAYAQETSRFAARVPADQLRRQRAEQVLNMIRESSLLGPWSSLRPPAAPTILRPHLGRL